MSSHIVSKHYNRTVLQEETSIQNQGVPNQADTTDPNDCKFEHADDITAGSSKLSKNTDYFKWPHSIM